MASTKYAGLVILNSGGPLYCEVHDDHYWVVNGAYEIDRETLQCEGSDFVAAVVIEDMPHMGYNKACRIIEERFAELTTTEG